LEDLPDNLEIRIYNPDGKHENGNISLSKLKGYLPKEIDTDNSRPLGVLLEILNDCSDLSLTSRQVTQVFKAINNETSGAFSKLLIDGLEFDFD
jgi:hypothetical protein